METKTKEIAEAGKSFAKEIIEGLEPLAEKMGVASKELYGIFVKQVWNEAIIEILKRIFLLLIISVVCYFLIFNSFSVGKQQNGNPSDHDVSMFFGCIILLLSLIGIGDEILNILKNILNPDYYAIEKITRLIMSSKYR